MIKTRTDLWTVALLSSLGIYSNACVASSSDSDATQAGLRDGGNGESTEQTPTTDPEEHQNTSADDGAEDDQETTLSPPSKPSNTAMSPDASGSSEPNEPEPNEIPPVVSTGPDPIAPVNSDASTPSTEDGGSPFTPVDAGSIVVPSNDAGACKGEGCKPTAAPGCEGATKILVGDVDTGLVQCANGVVHRPSPVECPNHLSTHQPPATDSAEGSCTSDAECNAAPNGYCDIPPSMGNALPSTQCLYGCTSDAECGADQFCQCGESIGRCVDSACTSANDCEGEYLCAQYFDRFGVGCGEPASYACQTAADECNTDADCAAGDFGGNCNVIDGSRSCEDVPGLACGRPFLVAGEQRLAAVARGSNWSAQLAVPALLATLTNVEREKLGQAWTEIGLMEHASVAAFARFTLQLLHLGAPADLVQASVAASSDEARHALCCFALASAYTSSDVGPGALSMSAALDAVSLAEVVALAVREGCVGETIAALEAAESAEHCDDAVVRHVLVGIAEDERRHAELAWHFVAWALKQDASLAGVVRRECERAVSEFDQVRQGGGDEFDSSTHGVLTAALRSHVRAAACRDVVRPCMLALLETARTNAAESVTLQRNHALTA